VGAYSSGTPAVRSGRTVVGIEVVRIALRQRVNGRIGAGEDTNSRCVNDPTILHADDGSPHADWIFERT
jgi:hypothetical protein